MGCLKLTYHTKLDLVTNEPTKELTLNKSDLQAQRGQDLTNHLGNVLATITDRKTYNPNDGYYEPVITMKADYYAFGMLMPNRFEGVDESRHLFNGMEHDMEVSGEGNSYTTQFRQYDPRLGRWKSLDPLMAQFPWQSPYVAFDNNPIFYTDPLGLAAEGGGDENDPKNLNGKEDPGNKRMFKVKNGEGGKWYRVKKGDTYSNKETGEVFEYQGRKEGGWKTIEGKIQQLDEFTVTADKVTPKLLTETFTYQLPPEGDYDGIVQNARDYEYDENFGRALLKDITADIWNNLYPPVDRAVETTMDDNSSMEDIVLAWVPVILTTRGGKVKSGRLAPTKLKIGDKLDLSKFEPGKKGTLLHKKSGYSLEKDIAGSGKGHGGSYYKLKNKKNKKNERVYTVSEEGKILRD